LLIQKQGAEAILKVKYSLIWSDQFDLS
jgi:hypothetical protein